MVTRHCIVKPQEEMAAKEDMKVVVFYEETIKPSSPTPSHLGIFKLSLFDKLIPNVYVPMLMFYASDNSTNTLGGLNLEENKVEVSQRLRKSLSETLTLFYPYAGRLTPDLSVVQCIDQGVHYSEGRANFQISDVLQQIKDEELRQHFIPTATIPPESDSTPLLLVRITFFECGGLVICLNQSHKIADASSMIKFAQAWAAISDGKLPPFVPDFTAAEARFPVPESLIISGLEPDILPGLKDFVLKRSRLVFDTRNISELKAKSASMAVPQPTRMEAISAFLWKCSTKVASSSSISAKSILSWSVNIRSRLTRPLPNSSFGNSVILLLIKEEDSEKIKKELELADLVCKIREQFQTFLKGSLQGEDEKVSTVISLIATYGKQRLVRALVEGSSWHAYSNICGMGSYETNFGWGKPTWVTILAEISTFSDTSNGGVEAWVMLTEKELLMLEQLPELLEFASLNPSPLLQHKNMQQNKPLSSL